MRCDNTNTPILVELKNTVKKPTRQVTSRACSGQCRNCANKTRRDMKVPQ